MITLEMIKYGTKELDQEITNIFNDMFERNNCEVAEEIGKSTLKLIPDTKTTKRN